MKQGFIKNIVTGLTLSVCAVGILTGCKTDGSEVTEDVVAITSDAETNGAGAQTADSEETRYSISETAGVYDIGPSTSSGTDSTSSGIDSTGSEDLGVVEDGSYTSMEEVSEYIHEFGHLPDNYITKSEAKKLGWKSNEGNLTIVAPGKSIGGDSFGNREGKLPKQNGRKYYECDIDYTGGTRNAKRLIYSNDGLIFYTEDHYNTFEQLY